MSPDPKAIAPAPLITGKHLVCGSGGSRAILGSAGAVVACKLAGIEFDTIGGISGGAVPAVALAAGIEPHKLMQLAVDVDFSSLVPRHATPLHTVLAFLLKDRFEYTRPKKGVLNSENLGRYFDELVPTWPKNFWTMAVVARTQILFTDHGVFQYLRNGQRRVISNEPAPVGIAIRATCAIPGIIDAVPYKGRYLFDGALSWDGQCPVGIPMRHFGAQPASIIGSDVGDEQSRLAPVGRTLWSLLCGGHCVDEKGPKTPIPDGVLMIKPNIWSVRSLQFSLSEDQKWQAVMSGFQEAVIQLTRAGLLSGERQQQAFELCMDIEKLKALAK
jgi:predicted acylesterase/phospholipase RssA